VRAVVCRAYGLPETLAVADVRRPSAGPGQVHIAVAAAGVNFADTLMIAGTYQDRPPFPFVLGLEVAGTVVGTGAHVTGLAAGDRVMAALDRGGFAEEVVAEARDVVVLPPGLSFELAAGFAVAYGTAYGALAWRARLGAGETLLVLGAAGGAGAAAVEIGKAMGARVIAAASGPEKLAAAVARGADHTIDYRREDLRERALALTEGRGVDVVFDPVGGEAFDAALRAIAWEGRLVVIGFASGGVPRPPANILLVKNCGVLGYYWGSYRRHDPARVRAAFETLMGWVVQGRVHPRVSHRLPLARAAEALRLLIDRKAMGKAVLITDGGR